LTPSERNAWQVIRLLTQTSTARGPRYEELQTYLSNLPGGLASRETVARVLRLLRLTHWLSSVPRGRDARSGRLLGSLYVLHEEPLTPTEALELDPAYLQLLGSSLTHAAKAVRIVAAQVVDELKRDEYIDQEQLPTRLELLANQIHAGTVTKTARRESAQGVTNPVRIRANRSTDAELGGSDPVRTHDYLGAD